MYAYSKLTDNVIQQILYSEDCAEELQEAKTIINNIFYRRLYQYVGYVEGRCMVRIFSLVANTFDYRLILLF